MRPRLLCLALMLVAALVLACPQHVCADQSTRARTMAEASRGGWGSGRILTMTATAYTNSPSDTGKRPGDPGYGITKSGTVARVGEVAVDPRVIPLGTRLYVEGYGPAVAGDTGADIQGERIDEFYETRAECVQFGRRTVAVWIVQ